MPLISSMSEQTNISSPKHYQLFFIPTEQHSIIAFCPFTRVAARGDSVFFCLFFFWFVLVCALLLNFVDITLDVGKFTSVAIVGSSTVSARSVRVS